jgi:NitT/TauT family transport system ATP-binding protein
VTDVTQPVVEVSGVSKTFGAGTSGVTALEGIDLTIGAGEFVSLIGPSGCGKSTLLRLIGDLTTPSAGRVLVNGKPARQGRLDRDYGMVFQAPVLMDWRTIQANIELPLEIMGYPKEDRTRRSTDLLRLVELEGFGSRHPWQLSGGMQQRVAIARALAFDPKLLLMDEPFGALDAITRERMHEFLLDIWEQHRITIIFVTHDIEEAILLGDRVAVMGGRPPGISEVIDIPLARPRHALDTDTEVFLAAKRRIRVALRS